MRIAQRAEKTYARRSRGRLVVALCLYAGVAQAQPLTPLRLQVSLSSEEPIAWRGEMSLSEGRLEKLQPLNLDPDAAAALSVDAGRVRVWRRRPLRRDVFNVTAVRPPGGDLLISQRDPNGDPIEPVRVSLDAALSAPQTVSVGPGGVQITVTRVANDRLRIETDRQSLVFQPGEEFAFELLAEPAGVERGRPYDLAASLVRGRQGEEVWRGPTTRVEAPAIGAARLPTTIPLPSTEGVYTVRLTATRPPGFLSRFPRSGSPPVITERAFQVAVFDTERRPPAPTAWNETHAFEPGATNWVRRVPEWMRWRRLPWPQAGPLGSEADAPAETISARSEDGDCHWRAYPLPIEQAGALYAVEVLYEGEPDDALTMVVVEPDALGDLRPIGRAVTRPARRWNRSAGALTLQLTVRPRTASPMLVLANPSASRSVRFGRIRLLRAAETPVEPPPAERLVALDWSEADLPHAVGASHVVSPIGRFEQPDLQTHYETASALAERVLIAGANAAVVSVNEGGGALYPSGVWTTPRFDLGCWADGAGDLPRRELLSLIAQEFRRRGLRLILAVRFDEAVPALERNDGPPSYSPTDPRTLAAQEAALAEAIDAIGDPDVLAGVAVRLGLGGWALLEHAEEDPNQTATALQRGYEQLATRLKQRAPNATLLAAPSELARGAAPEAPLTPRLGGANTAASEYLQQIGLTTLAAGDRGVRVVTPFGGSRGFAATPRSANAAKLDLLRESLAGAAGGRVVAFRSDGHSIRLKPSPARPRSNKGANPPGGMELEAWIVDRNAEGELLSAAVGESTPLLLLDGPATAGWREESISTRRADLTRAPSPPTVREPSQMPGGDVTAIAFDADATRSIALATNRTPWPRRARLTLATPTRLRGEQLDAAPSAGGEWFEPGQHAIELVLAPHQTVGWRFAGSGVQVVGLRIEPSPEAEGEIAAAVADLQSRDTTARRSYEAAANASFERVAETPESGPFAGWAAGVGVSRDVEAAYAGEASARLSASSEAPSVLTSDPFPMPTTGQMVLSFRLRPGVLDPNAELRIELEQVDGSYRNGTRVLASQLVASGSAPPSGEWLPPIVFPIDDLPLLANERLRFRFTLAGEGELNLDDLQAEDLLLPLDGYGSIELRSEKFALIRLLSATEDLLSEGRLGACRERLDSYWARFLVDHFPIHHPEPTQVTEDLPAEAESEEPTGGGETPSISQRLKGYLPRWWR